MTRLVGLVLKRGREERLAQGAGGLTFTTLLSLVPLLVVSFALFTRIPVLRPAGERVREHLLRGLLPPDIARTVLQYLGRFTVNAGGLTLAGSLFLVVSALALVLSVEASLNRIWQVRKPRPIPRRLALCAVLLLAGPVAIGASLWATSWLLAASGALVATSPPWVRQALQAAPVVLGAIAFACLYRFVPHAPVRRRDAIAGGVLAAVAFELGKRGFALYLLNVPTYKTVYGGFAAVPVFLVWVYFSWLVTLGAALIAANLGSGSRQPRRRLSRA